MRGVPPSWGVGGERRGQSLALVGGESGGSTSAQMCAPPEAPGRGQGLSSRVHPGWEC